MNSDHEDHEARLDRAAEQGPLPGLAEQEAAQRRGDDDSVQPEQENRSLFGEIVEPDNPEEQPTGDR